MKDISAKAYGFLVAIYQHGVNISAESIMAHFGVGRRSALSGLKELRLNNYIETKPQRINNRIMTVSKLTQKAERVMFGLPRFVESHNVTPVTPTEHIKQNKTYSTVISKKTILDEVKEEYETMNVEVRNMSGWGGLFDPTSDPMSEVSADIAKDLIRKKAEKAEFREKKKDETRAVRKKLQSERKTTREELPTAEWHPRHVCFEFADRIEKHFHIAPWEVTQSRFCGALTALRNRLGTNGEIEVEVMDIFFRRINIKDYKDAEILWKLYISQFPSMIGEVKMAKVTDETKAMAKKSMEKAVKEFGNIVRRR